MAKSKKVIETKCKKIKLVLTDVDGVLTDSGRYFSEKGETLKKFHTRDGMGVNLLLRNGIKTAILTKENSRIVKQWAKQMNVSKVYFNAIKKEKFLPKIEMDYGIKSTQIAYIGDDVNDLDLLKKVGLSSSPHDGISAATKIVDYVCKRNGGQGVLREVADLILSKKYLHKNKWYYHRFLIEA